MIVHVMAPPDHPMEDDAVECTARALPAWSVVRVIYHPSATRVADGYLCPDCGEFSGEEGGEA